MGERELGPTRAALKAGGVEVHGPVGRVVDEQRRGPVGALLIVAGREQAEQRGEHLPAAGLVGLAGWTRADDDHRRARVARKCGPGGGGRHTHECPGRRLAGLAADLERRVPVHDDVQLLAGVVLALVVFVDQPVPVSMGGHRSDTERRDPQVMAYWPKRAAAPVNLLDLLQPGH
jgi:hypothetical protein